MCIKLQQEAREQFNTSKIVIILKDKSVIYEWLFVSKINMKLTKVANNHRLHLAVMFTSVKMSDSDNIQEIYYLNMSISVLGNFAGRNFRRIFTTSNTYFYFCN